MRHLLQKRRSDAIYRTMFSLWILQGLLALIFLFAAGIQLDLPLETLTGTMPISGLFVRFISAAEVLGAVCLA